MFDASIAFALNKIIQNSHFKKKVSLEEQKAQKEDWFLRGRQIAFMIYDYFRVTVAHDTVLDYADLFSVILLNGNVQEFDTKWTCGVHLHYRGKLERTMCDVQYAEVTGRENPTDMSTKGLAAEAISKRLSAVSGRYWVRLTVQCPTFLCSLCLTLQLTARSTKGRGAMIQFEHSIERTKDTSVPKGPRDECMSIAQEKLK